MPPRKRLPVALKGIAGFVVALAVWWALLPLYARTLAAVGTPVKRMFEQPSVTRLKAEKTRVIVDRQDFPPRSARPSIPTEDVTFNFILLATLFTLSVPVLGTRNVSRFVLAAAILFLTHMIFLLVQVESIYALKLGPWSKANYSTFEQELWGAAWHFYRVVGLYAIAFALWFALRPSAAQAEPAAPAPRRKKRR